FESQLEHDIRHFRSLGEHGGPQQTTTFNHVVADRLGQLMAELEQLAGCSRQPGGHADFPLRSHAAQPVSLQAVQAKMQEIESDFRMVGRKGRSVFGLPFNQPYTDYKRIWESVRDSHILELGGEGAEYAVKVRVFPYACGVLSIWIFVAVAMDDE
ncbi:unnamed protein product, partial [Polarella glacialis]